MSHLPILPVVKPSDLVGQANGHLPENLLREVGPAGKLHHLAARAFVAMRNAAQAEGFHLTYTYGGCFRSYAAQEALFRRRYTPTYDFAVNTTASSRYWQGQKWWKLRGVAAAASPGSSNHGWGLAIDLALDSDPSDGLGPDDAIYIAPALDWLVANAWRYGFSWELQSEPWHVRYIAGNAVPAAVLDYEANGPADPIPMPKTWPLRRGIKGQEVKDLQVLLNRCGADPRLTEDGDFGPKTETGVKLFEGFFGWPQDGRVTQAEFIGYQGWLAYLLALPKPYPTLRVGSTGKFVSYLQRVLRACDYPVVIDGNFGPQTEKYVKAFQRCVKLPTIDGIVGESETWPKVRDVGDGMKVPRP